MELGDSLKERIFATVSAVKTVSGVMVLIVAAWWFASRHIAHGHSDATPIGVSFDMALHGKVGSPFCYRRLVLWIVGWLDQLHIPGINTTWGILFGLEIVAFIVLGWALWIYIGLFCKPLAFRLICITLAWSAMYGTFINTYPPMPYLWYDIPSVLIFTLGLLFIKQRKVIPYYAVFILGTLNKETTCFLTLAFLGRWARDEGFTRAFWHGATQFALWVLLKAALVMSSSPSPEASWVWSMFWRNIEQLKEPRWIFLMISALSYFPFLVYFGCRYVHDPDVRWMIYVVAPSFVVGMLFVGILWEVRIYGELIPLFSVAFADILASRTDLKCLD